MKPSSSPLLAGTLASPTEAATGAGVEGGGIVVRAAVFAGGVAGRGPVGVGSGLAARGLESLAPTLKPLINCRI